MKVNSEELLFNIACKEYDNKTAKESFNLFINEFNLYIKKLAYSQGKNESMRKDLYSLFFT